MKHSTVQRAVNIKYQRVLHLNQLSLTFMRGWPLGTAGYLRISSRWSQKGSHCHLLLPDQHPHDARRVHRPMTRKRGSASPGASLSRTWSLEQVLFCISLEGAVRPVCRRLLVYLGEEQILPRSHDGTLVHDSSISYIRGSKCGTQPYGRLFCLDWAALRGQPEPPSLILKDISWPRQTSARCGIWHCMLLVDSWMYWEYTRG